MGNISSSLKDLIYILSIASVSGMTFIVFVVSCYKGIQKVRHNAKTAAKVEEQRVKDAYDDGVADEKERCDANKENETERITRLKDIAEELKMLAEQRKERIDYLDTTITRFAQQVKDLQARDTEREAKFLAVLETSAGITADLLDLQKRFTALEQHHKDCAK